MYSLFSWNIDNKRLQYSTVSIENGPPDSERGNFTPFTTPPPLAALLVGYIVGRKQQYRLAYVEGVIGVGGFKTYL